MQSLPLAGQQEFITTKIEDNPPRPFTKSSNGIFQFHFPPKVMASFDLP